MPTYVFSTEAGRLTQSQRLDIVRSLTTIHAEETGAPRYLVQVVFHDVQPHSLYVGGEAAPAGQVWIRGDIRSGRTAAVKRRMIERILYDVCAATGIAEEEVWVYICDIPADNIAEYGRVLPPPGDEAAWLTTLPEGLRTRLLSLG
jgi:phenylpyruvate tautomerase PptA (4-oxalocrotonate tautomerase family)